VTGAGKRSCIPAFLVLFSFAAACSNSNDLPDFSAPTRNLSDINFNINLPAHANKKFSAYVFMGGVLKGAVLSNAMLDASGQYYARTFKVDSSNCITNQLFNDGTMGTYSVHYRVDSTGSANFIYPTGCPSSAGFLSDAGLGKYLAATLASGNVTFAVTSMDVTAQIIFNISGTGLGTVSRNTYCSVVDGGISNPGSDISSRLGFYQGVLNYVGGDATAFTALRAVTTVQNPLNYSCWIDTNGSGAYNSGDLVASGALMNYTQAISAWSTVP
jgi:hypothetical protein